MDLTSKAQEAIAYYVNSDISPSMWCQKCLEGGMNPYQNHISNCPYSGV